MTAPLFDSGDRPQTPILTLAFYGGRSDSAGVILHAGDVAPVLPIKFVDETSDPIDLTDLTPQIEMTLNGTTVTRDCVLEDEDTGLTSYYLQAGDLPSGGLLKIRGKLVTMDAEPMDSDLCYVAVED